MLKVKVVYSFQDIHTGQIYASGDIVTFTKERLEEVNTNLPNFVVPFDDTEEPKKKVSRKKKEVTDELPESETEV